MNQDRFVQVLAARDAEITRLRAELDLLRPIVAEARWVTHTADCADEEGPCPGDESCPNARVLYATSDEAWERLIALDELERMKAVAEDLGKELTRLAPPVYGPKEGDPF